ncbi:hypothetical protein K3495_g11752 [Podosphaera aphanis]|nr:hypothetical protein K3495_g11752 [Podosphaera aphanis]
MSRWRDFLYKFQKELIAIRNTIIKLLYQRYLRSNGSLRESPAIHRAKQNGGVRFCVSYRGLGVIIIPDSYQLLPVNKGLTTQRNSLNDTADLAIHREDSSDLNTTRELQIEIADSTNPRRS